MAENNLLMTIVLVVAATLLFSGGLTGNASYQKNFGFATTQPLLDTSGEVTCSPEKEGVILEGGDAVIRLKNSECKWDIVADCADSSRPFLTVDRVVQCRGLAISSANDAFGAQ